MKLVLRLEGSKGEWIETHEVDFPGVTCMSDAGQQLPKLVFMQGTLFPVCYGFHRLTEYGAVFRPRKIMYQLEGAFQCV